MNSMTIKLSVLLILLLSLNACSALKQQSGDRVTSPEVMVEDRSQQNDRNTDTASYPKVITTAALSKPMIDTPKPPASRQAVLDILARSKKAIDKQNFNEAESLLKRALRIEPANPWLWYNLSVVNYYQEQYQQAINMALKSKNLVKNDPTLMKNNDKVLEQCYLKLGQ